MNYLKMMYSNDNVNDLKLPSVGKDNDLVYGYTQEHHTVELYMQFWKRHDLDVVKKRYSSTLFQNNQSNLFSLEQMHGKW